MAKTSELFEHAQRYVREVMADRLREEGFVSYKGEDIHWYRLVDNKVVHAIYFCTRHTGLPAFFDIYYGCHPLFVPPVFQKSPYLYAEPGYEQMNMRIPETVPGSTPRGFEGTMIHGMVNRPYRVPDAMIWCPQDKNNGLDILEKIFPVMDGIRTPTACYEMHKKRRQGEIENDTWLTVSTYFVDEALYVGDEAMYPFCQMFVTSKISLLESAEKTGRFFRKEDKRELERLLELRRVFVEDRRQEYLQTFPAREQETLRKLERYTAIRREI